MTICVITAHVSGGPADDAVLARAHELAEAFKGHIDAAYARPNPCLTPPPTGLGLFPSVYRDLAAQAETVWRETADAARGKFEAWRIANRLTAAERAGGGRRPSAAWREAGAQEALGRASPLADLLILPPPAARGGDTLGHELTLLHEGRPVLFAPAGASAPLLGGAVLIAWNGSSEAFRAVGAALPLLARAKRVVICTVAEKNFTAAIAGALVDYLAWHGIAAETQAAPKAGSVEAALEAAARAVDANLLVMGAYTRGRLREWVFGGFTRHMLERAKLPVLMAR
ncbi:MAG: universal stress protein [Alphaproteobacteria bacterium]